MSRCGEARERSMKTRTTANATRAARMVRTYLRGSEPPNGLGCVSISGRDPTRIRSPGGRGTSSPSDGDPPRTRAHATRTLAFDSPFADERTVGCRGVLLDLRDRHEVVTQGAGALRAARQQGQRRRQRALLPGTHPNVVSRSSSTAFSASEMEPRPRKPPADSAIRRALPSTRSRINERSPGSSSFSNLVE